MTTEREVGVIGLNEHRLRMAEAVQAAKAEGRAEEKELILVLLQEHLHCGVHYHSGSGGCVEFVERQIREGAE